MMQSLWVVIPVGVLFTAFIVFAFRQGWQVRRPPEGTPPEQWPHE